MTFLTDLDTTDFVDEDVLDFDALADGEAQMLERTLSAGQRRQCPVSDLIRYNPTSQEIEDEWTGAAYRRRWHEAAQPEEELPEDYFEKFIEPNLAHETQYAEPLPNWASALSVFVAVFVAGSLFLPG